MQRFYKGRTNNHLTFMMVDATDFATPESAASAATKIKIYGKLRGQAAHNFVTSGTGSLTNDIAHVGASALGLYTIALAKADLSDASAAWYDQYIISLSATGCAYQTIIAEGVIDESALSVLVSDAVSAAQQGNSRVLLVQSRLSDLDSRLASEFSDTYSLLSSLNSEFLSRVPKETAARSQLSDLHSDIRSFLVVMSGADSDTYSLLSDLQSDFQSRVPKRVATDSQLSDVHSDLKSAIAGITVTISASDVSDIASAVVAGLPVTSAISDIYSMLSDFYSDFQSRVPKRVATDSQLSDLHSDLKSHLTVTSGVISDTYSLLSDLNSNIFSRIPSEPASRSQLSDLASDVKSAVMVVQSMASDAASAAVQANSRVLLVQSTTSDIYSLLSDVQSDFQSRVPKRVATDSQLSDLHSDLRSFATANHSTISDIYSLLSDLHSDVAVLSGVVSDVYSNLAAGVDVGASSLSDIRSAITANGVLRAGTEPAAVVGHTDNLATKVDWLTALSRNKITQTATVQSLRNDADNADIASAAVADDGTTFTRSEWGN